MHRVLIPQDISEDGKEYLRERDCEIIVGSGSSVEIIKNEVVGCDAIIARTAEYPIEVMAAAPELKVIGRCGVGVDNIDLKAAEKLGIWVTNAPESNANTVAELGLGFIITLGRQITFCEREFRNGNWEIRNQFKGMDLEGKTLGVVGFGKIGRRTAEKAHLGLGMKILAYDPFIKKENLPDWVELVDSWEDIFSKPDFVSLHLPYNGKKLIGEKEFSLMKESAYFMNLARGELVDEQALINSLAENRIAGAALDVYSSEPPGADNPLLKMNNVLTTPHNAGLTVECSSRMSLHAAMGVYEVLSGVIPKWPVNRPITPKV